MDSPSNILALFRQLRGRSKVAQQAAARSLSALTNAPGGAAAILQSGADLSLLAARAQNGRGLAVRCNCLGTLTNLATTEAGRAAVAAAGAIPVAVALLRASGDAKLLEYASGPLRSLASGTDVHLPAMVAAGAFEALAGVLQRSSHDAVLEEVGVALCNATANARNPPAAAAAAACIAAAAHTELLRQLSRGGLGAEAKSALAAATRALCYHAAGKAAVVEAGGVDVLARCLADDSTEVQVEAAGALMNLASGSSHFSGAVASHPRALPGLAALLCSPEQEVQASAGSAIGNILWNSPGSTGVLVAAGVLPGIVHLLQHSQDPEQLRRQAGNLAVLAAREPAARDAAVQAGAVAALQRLSASANAAVRAAADEALEELEEGSEYASSSEPGTSEDEEPPAKRARGSP